MSTNKEKIQLDAEALMVFSTTIRDSILRLTEGLETVGPILSAAFERSRPHFVGAASPDGKPYLIPPISPAQQLILKNVSAILPDRTPPKMAPLPDDYSPNKTILISGVN